MAKQPRPIDVDRCKELFDYRDGKLIWKVTTSSHSKAGEVAGTLNQQTGYFQVGVNSKIFKVSRIIYAMHHGDPGEMQVDHINQIKTDNRIENLRTVTHQENSKNKTKQKNNASGITGVNWDKRNKKWLVRITVDGKKIHCGRFTHLRAAAVERKYQEIKYGYHDNHGNPKQSV